MKEFINRRIWDKDHGLSYFCSVCGKYKPEKEFYKRKNSKWNVEPRCKLHYSKKGKEDEKENSHLKFTRLTEGDFIGARELLNIMGYNTTGSESVHEQFKKRHNLK
jgi:hypothetical protein